MRTRASLMGSKYRPGPRGKVASAAKMKLGAARKLQIANCKLQIANFLVPKLRLGTHVPKLCFESQRRRETEFRRQAFPKRVWERGLKCKMDREPSSEWRSPVGFVSICNLQSAICNLQFPR